MTNAGQNSIESGIRPTVNNPIERFDRSALYRVTRLISASFGLLLCAGCVAYGYDSYDPRAHHEHDVPAGHLPSRRMPHLVSRPASRTATAARQLP